MNPEQAYAEIWRRKLADNQAPPGSQHIDRCKWTAELFPAELDPPYLLDIGCGSGALLAAAKRRGWEHCGIDIDSSVCDWLVHSHGFNATSWNVDQQGMWHQDGVFGVVTCCDVIEHLFDPAHMLAEAFRVLRPGGLLYVGTPNCANWRRVQSLAAGTMFRTSGDEMLRDGGHIGYYAPADLVAIIKAAGFVDVTIHLRKADPAPAHIWAALATLDARREWAEHTYLIAAARKP